MGHMREVLRSRMRESTAQDVPEGLQGFRDPKAVALEEAESERSRVESKDLPTKQKKRELSRIAELILRVDAHVLPVDGEDEDTTLRLARKQLAAALGCTTEDLQNVVDMYGVEWQEIVLEERIRLGIDSTQVRDASWDRLESAVLRKLIHLTDGNLVKDPMELLAIAKAANMANRGDRKMAAKDGKGTSFGVQVNNFLPGDPNSGVLPAGNLGKITLNLTPRLVKQIEADPRNKSERQIDSVDMMTLDEIRGVADEPKEDESK